MATSTKRRRSKWEVAEGEHAARVRECLHRLFKADTPARAKELNRALIVEAIAGDVAAAEVVLSFLLDDRKELEEKLGAALARCDEEVYSSGMQSALFYRLAEYDQKLRCWREGPRAYTTASEARAAATAPGRYRLAALTPEGVWEDGTCFEVNGPHQARQARSRPLTHAPAPAPARGYAASAHHTGRRYGL